MDPRRVTNATSWPLTGSSITRMEITLLPDEKANYQAATQALRERLDSGNQTLAALDFRHLSQKVNEPVSDFIGRLEKVFQTGFG